MTTYNWGIFIPTFNRKNILALKMLEEDKKLTLNICVRHEQLEEGFYDFLKEYDRVRIIDLGTDIQNISETRNRIMDFCIDNEIDYCFMIDDGITTIAFNDIFTHSIVETCEYVIQTVLNDQMSNLIICANWRKRFAYSENMETRYWVLDKQDNHKYFNMIPNQFLMIDVNKYAEYDLHYLPMDEAGFEDASFFIQTLQKGLITLNVENVVSDGVFPNIKKEGGNHSSENLEMKYHHLARKCLNYFRDMYGISTNCRYRSYANAFLEFVSIDFDYFRNVLVENRDVNKKIINRKFKM